MTLNASTFSNYDLTVKTMAGAEYDFFPDAESTRRSLTVTYLAGIARYDFEDVTIFDKLTETNAEHQLGAGLGLRQPWGSVGFQSTFSQPIADPSRNRLNVHGDADVRRFKGFSFNMFGDYSRIRDPINLRKGSASPEEVPRAGKKDGGEGGIRTLGRTLKALQRFSKPPPSATRPPHRRR